MEEQRHQALTIVQVASYLKVNQSCRDFSVTNFLGKCVGMANVLMRKDMDVKDGINKDRFEIF